MVGISLPQTMKDNLQVITCSCGARVRLRPEVAGKSFRCPKCKAEFLATLDAKVLSSYRAEPGAKEAVCPTCQSAIGATDVVIQCPNCDQIHHKECWEEVGG